MQWLVFVGLLYMSCRKYVGNGVAWDDSSHTAGCTDVPLLISRNWSHTHERNSECDVPLWSRAAHVDNEHARVQLLG